MHREHGQHVASKTKQLVKLQDRKAHKTSSAYFSFYGHHEANQMMVILASPSITL
jgi:hypothetical protein